MKIKELLEGNGEIFQFGKWTFDIDLIMKHIEAGDVPFNKQLVNIKTWATRMLGLDRDKETPKGHIRLSLVRVDDKHWKGLSDERMNDPIIVVETEIGFLIVDGNHRVAKAYMSGKDEVEAIVFDKEATKKLNKPIKVPKKAKLKLELDNEKDI